MIITRTPFRLSLFGGGTDYPRWFRDHGGAVLGTAIDKYCYISLRELPSFFEHRHKIVYSQIETVRSTDEIKHPAVRALLQEYPVTVGLEIHHDADLPARSGIGSSSAFTVGLLNALRAFQGRMSSAAQLAMEAIRVEQEVIGENVGSQDQVWAAYGGMNVIEFEPSGRLSVKSVILTPARRMEFESHLMLFFTGFSRVASEIAGKQIANMPARERQLHTIRKMVDEGLAIFQDDAAPIIEIGRLLHRGWMMKRELAQGVSTLEIDEIYDAARAAGAVGGKLLGAGGGGFIVFFVEPSRQGTVRNALRNLVEVQFLTAAPGSQVVLYEPNDFKPSLSTPKNLRREVPIQQGPDASEKHPLVLQGGKRSPSSPPSGESNAC